MHNEETTSAPFSRGEEADRKQLHLLIICAALCGAIISVSVSMFCSLIPDVSIINRSVVTDGAFSLPLIVTDGTYSLPLIVTDSTFSILLIVTASTAHSLSLR